MNEDETTSKSARHYISDENITENKELLSEDKHIKESIDNFQNSINEDAKKHYRNKNVTTEQIVLKI